MNALFLATAAASLTATMPAGGSVITLGGSYARACYTAAEAGTASSQALQDCDRAFALQALNFNDRIATHVNRGIVRMLRNDHAGARTDFEAATVLKPSEPEAWLNLGVLLYNQGRSAEAVTMFGRAIDLKTRRPALAHFGRGLAHEETGNVRAAYADLRRAQSLRPNWDLPAAELQRYQVRRN